MILTNKMGSPFLWLLTAHLFDLEVCVSLEFCWAAARGLNPRRIWGYISPSPVHFYLPTLSLLWLNSNFHLWFLKFSLNWYLYVYDKNVNNISTLSNYFVLHLNHVFKFCGDLPAKMCILCMVTWQWINQLFKSNCHFSFILRKNEEQSNFILFLLIYAWWLIVLETFWNWRPNDSMFCAACTAQPIDRRKSWVIE